ncbi:MAG: TonB-dependent receptor, partial [Herminiimonas sp.]|nr:TonB-dependent receptor [Herminiimonas sp.]
MPSPISRCCLAVLSVTQAWTFTTPAGAQSIDKVLPEVVVSAPAPTRVADTATVGGFVAAPLLQTPASISVITLDQMRDLGIRQTAGAMKVDASINESYNAVGYAEQFSVRGFALDNASSYRKDGLAISSDASIPLENKERIEILKGLAGLQAGIATPGGIINYVTKRPTATPVRSITIEASERGTLFGTVDLGGRFSDSRFGYRVNASAEKLRSYVKGADGNRQFVSAAFDWQLTPDALLQFDVDNQHKSQLTAPGFQLLGGTDLPTGVSARTMLNNQAWSKPVETDSRNVGLRLAYRINPEWNASLAINQHRLKRDDFAAFPYGCGSAGLFPGFCANGDYDVYDYQSTGEYKSLLASQAELHGKFATGSLQHALTLGVANFRRRDEFGDCVYGLADCAGSVPNGVSNIYHPMAVAPSDIVTGPVRLRRSGNENSFFIQDVVKLTDGLTLHAGARSTQIK